LLCSFSLSLSPLNGDAAVWKPGADESKGMAFVSRKKIAALSAKRWAVYAVCQHLQLKNMIELKD